MSSIELHLFVCLFIHICMSRIRVKALGSGVLPGIGGMASWDSVNQPPAKS